MAQTTHHWLQLELERRKRANPRYSARAFAKHLGIGAGRMCEYLTGKRTLTRNMTIKIARRLGYPQADIDRVTASSIVGKTHNQTSSKYRLLEDDKFQLITEWWHYAILHLVDFEQKNQSATSLALRLGIDVNQARAALARLERLGMVKQKTGKYVKISGTPTTSVDIPSEAIRKSHRDRLHLAICALDDIPVERRDFSSIIFPVNSASLPQLKTAIEKFRRKLPRMATSDHPTDVVNLSIQLFPVTKTIEKTREEK